MSDQIDELSAKSASSKADKNSGQKKSLKENILSLLIALVIVLMIRSTVVEAYKIPSESMLPTLLVGDHIFVNKFSYGVKLPFTEWFGDPVYLTRGKQPARGDIIVFIKPESDPDKPRVNYIKRVVGIPGDSIAVREKVLYINNQAVNREALTPDAVEKVLDELKLDEVKYDSSRIRFFSEDLANQKNFSDAAHIMIDDSSFLTDSFAMADSCSECKEGIIPADRFFVMGDNRDHSHDSRFWGLVPMENIKGKAMIIWLSLWLDDFTFRPGRIGKMLK